MVSHPHLPLIAPTTLFLVDIIFIMMNIYRSDELFIRSAAQTITNKLFSEHLPHPVLVIQITWPNEVQ